ncbi:MAG: chemotaxis protein CheB [Pseudomonadota bacterium]|nr:chemotaxis protein CheB [Pseudomonadota bacterium]
MQCEVDNKNRNNKQSYQIYNKTLSEPDEATLIVNPAPKPIRLLIVDDSRLIRTAIRKIFDLDAQVKIVGEAANGNEALAIIPKLKPDVITLDINMPKMDGLLTLKHIMIKHPTATVMVSSLTKEGATKTFDALRFGAIDFIAKPSQLEGKGFKTQQQNILEKIKLAAAVQMENIRLSRTRINAPTNNNSTQTEIDRCVVFGASEGGYGAMLKIIPRLKPDLPAAYIGIIYAAPAYVDAFANYLNRHSVINVKRAIEGITLQSGTCYLATGYEYITAVKMNKKLALRVHPSPFPERRGTINILMLSLSEIMSNKTMGVILSGQDQDGAEGVAEIARVGGDVIIQSPQTCLFKEMAQTAIRMCNSGKIVADINIANAIEDYFNKTLKREDDSHVEKS